MCVCVWAMGMVCTARGPVVHPRNTHPPNMFGNPSLLRVHRSNYHTVRSITKVVVYRSYTSHSAELRVLNRFGRTPPSPPPVTRSVYKRGYCATPAAPPHPDTVATCDRTRGHRDHTNKWQHRTHFIPNPHTAQCPRLTAPLQSADASNGTHTQPTTRPP